jgi:hypothetical protein
MAKTLFLESPAAPLVPVALAFNPVDQEIDAVDPKPLALNDTFKGL